MDPVTVVHAWPAILLGEAQQQTTCPMSRPRIRSPGFLYYYVLYIQTRYIYICRYAAPLYSDIITTPRFADQVFENLHKHGWIRYASLILWREGECVCVCICVCLLPNAWTPHTSKATLQITLRPHQAYFFLWAQAMWASLFHCSECLGNFKRILVG